MFHRHDLLSWMTSLWIGRMKLVCYNRHEDKDLLWYLSMSRMNAMARVWEDAAVYDTMLMCDMMWICSGYIPGFSGMMIGIFKVLLELK